MSAFFLMHLMEKGCCNVQDYVTSPHPVVRETIVPVMNADQAEEILLLSSRNWLLNDLHV